MIYLKYQTEKRSIFPLKLIHEESDAKVTLKKSALSFRNKTLDYLGFNDEVGIIKITVWTRISNSI